MTEISWKTVGIVGGFGPEATVEFYRRILDYCNKRVKGMRANTGYPRMIIYNCNFIPFDTGSDTKRINPELIRVVKLLQENGADFISIPSNTPHLFYKEIASSVSIPVLNIVEETAATVRSRNAKKAAVIPAHKEVGDMYRNYLERYGIETVTPEISLQAQIAPLIEDFMAGRSNGAKDFFVRLTEKFDKGSDIIILACTELPMILGEDMNRYKFLDSMQVLAEATAEKALC